MSMSTMSSPIAPPPYHPAPAPMHPMHMLPRLSVGMGMYPMPADILGRRDSGSDSPDDDDEKERDLAARRASHNAVERQRRDKLNARILELASLLPNLAGVRRPSRIAITKSSIAYIHHSRKARITAAQQLRALHAEHESLRAEVNQWRSRAGVPALLEPRRSDAFVQVLSGAEIEVEAGLEGVDEDEFDERYGSGVVPPVYAQYDNYQAQLAYDYHSQAQFAYSVSPPSSASSASPYAHHAQAYGSPSPPSSAYPHPHPHVTSNAKFDVQLSSGEQPRIVSVSPTYAGEPPVFVKDEWALYGDAGAYSA